MARDTFSVKKKKRTVNSDLNKLPIFKLRNKEGMNLCLPRIQNYVEHNQTKLRNAFSHMFKPHTCFEIIIICMFF